MRHSLKNTLSFCLGAALLALGCGNGSPTAVNTERVTDPYPLALGNSWEYSFQQDAWINRDTTIQLGSYIDSTTGDTFYIDTTLTYQLHYSSQGQQKVTVTRTEAITGDEAFGLHFIHVMDHIFSPGADTTEEIHYLAPHGNEVLLKAIQAGYNTGGFIPFSVNAGQPPRLVARVRLDGKSRWVPLERLAGSILDLEPTESFLVESGPALASDGVQNRDDVYFYGTDYVLLFNELYKGQNWTAQSAAGVGGLQISRKVTNVLPDLSGFSGPIAEVEETNSLIESVSTTSYKLRYYFKGGVGIVQAEISDSDFSFGVQTPDGVVFLGTGTWQVVKKLTNYTVK